MKGFEYVVAGRRIKLQPADDVVAVRFCEPALYQVRSQVARSERLGPFDARFEVPHEKFTVFPVNTGDPAAAAADRLGRRPEVARSAPVFALGAQRVVATDRVIVKLKEDTPAHRATLRQLGQEILDVHEGEVLLRLAEGQDPLQIASRLAGFAWIEYAEPDFVTIGQHPRAGGATQVRPSSGLSDDRDYALTITQTDRAWTIQRGTSTVRIAILDDGVDSLHPDLTGAIVEAYDAVTDGPLVAPNPWDGHGTACAGLAAGAGITASGVRGVGTGCSILAVRIASSPYAAGPWFTSSSTLRRGIDWAVDHGAAVLSNSWGGGAPSNSVVSALDRARRFGRVGKGCIVVVAAGNHAGPVEFPCEVPGLLVISGTNEYDEFKTPFTRDMEHWWGSNSGPEVSVAAPSVHVRTTDIVGSGGMSAGSYNLGFNGTSAATPLAAGLAGLILSLDDSLAEIEVRRIICSTADKVGQFEYTDGRNDQLGFGRVNAFRALTAVTQKERPAPLPIQPAAQLVGVVRAIAAGTPRAGAFYLDQNGQASYLLRTFLASEATSPELEQANLAQLAPFEGRKVRVRYSALQETPFGAILWGVELILQESDDALLQVPAQEIRMGPGDSDSGNFQEEEDDATEVPANEVRLPFVDALV